MNGDVLPPAVGPLSRRRRLTRYLADWRLWAALAAFLAAAAVLMALVVTRSDLDDLRDESRCVNTLEGEVDYWEARNGQSVGEGLAAYAAGDDVGLARAVERQQREISPRLDEALAAWDERGHICH